MPIIRLPLSNLIANANLDFLTVLYDSTNINSSPVKHVDGNVENYEITKQSWLREVQVQSKPILTAGSILVKATKNGVPFIDTSLETLINGATPNNNSKTQPQDPAFSLAIGNTIGVVAFGNVLSLPIEINLIIRLSFIEQI